MYASEFLVGEKAEDVHHFRVTFKKLRAFIRLLADNPANKAPKIPTIYKDAYKLAGLYRDLILFRESILLPGNSETLHALDVDINAAKAKFVKQIGSLDYSVLVNKLGKTIRKRISKKALSRFIIKRKKQIKRILSSPIPQLGLHQLRKHLKDISYNLKLCHEDWNAFLPIAGKKNSSQIEKYIETLGDYQDAIASINQIEDRTTRTSSVVEKHILIRNRKKIARVRIQLQSKLT